MIKVQLGKHVVNRRSIVFLVDTSFEGDLYMKAANKFMHEMFVQLEPQDYFGYICIGSDDCIVPNGNNSRTNWPCQKLRMEKKETNTEAKESFLREIKRDEFMGGVLSQKRGSPNAMEIGMSEAKSWLNEI